MVKFTGTSGISSSISSQDDIMKINNKMLNFEIMLFKGKFYFLTITAKVSKYYIFLLFILLIFVNSPSLFAQKYSIDKQPTIHKTRKPFSFKRLFKKDASKAAAKQVRKQEKHTTKVLKNEQKNNQRYRKKANNNKEKGKERKVYTRMQRYEKESKRRRKNKPTKNFFERLFSKSKKHKKSRVKDT